MNTPASAGAAGGGAPAWAARGGRATSAAEPARTGPPAVRRPRPGSKGPLLALAPPHFARPVLLPQVLRSWCPLVLHCLLVCVLQHEVGLTGP